ncbi:MAG: YeeE/YedE family protein [Proteobacteria bacterium]|nr:YeeE/YedE family protein [Pseudomonadota bacterium]MCK4866479.1 YeeE/YedE family protein [Alphaproteobacteria bacterium]
MEDMEIGTVVAISGFVLGGVFGATANRTNFCTMGAISDMVFMGNWNRMRAWLMAIAVAMLVSQAMHAFEIVDLGESIYLTTNFGWAGAIIGGLMFGFGMTMGGGCGNKTLVRLGAGNLKSLVVAIVLGIFAYMTLRGLIGMGRVELEAVTNIDLSENYESQGIPDLLAGLTGASADTLRWIVTILAGGGLLAFCFKDAGFRASKRDMAAGLIIGLLVPAAWYATGVIGYDDFEPTQLGSFTFINPTGESIMYLMTFSGSTINFGISTVGGVIAGSFIMAMATKSFRVESFTDASDMIRHLIGAALMGTGGILALGCTVGQGIAGMSTLALGSLIALASIIAGGVYGMKYLEEGSFTGALAAMCRRG